MRYSFCAVLILSNSMLLAAAPAPELSPEEKAQQAFALKMALPSKSAREKAITEFEESHPVLPMSWQMITQAMNSDSDGDVRRTAFAALARMPARDTGVARLLVAAFLELKPNDIKTRIAYAKDMETHAFKYNIGAVLAEEVGRMRYEEDPKSSKTHKVTQTQKDEAKLKRDELKDMLAAFNAVAHSSVTAVDKETPTKVRKWWEENQSKLQKIDAELLNKFAKEDADAAKAAKEAKAAAAKLKQ